MPKAKKVVKKTITKKKVAVKEVATKAEAPAEAPIYDEYGVCIACKGGVEGCLHTNLVQGAGGSLTCATCGVCVSA